MKLAVVILNWNGREMLKKYLPSVLMGSGYSVIVADNGSTDGSVEMLRSEFPEVGVIELDRNYGFAEGYNRALSEVDAEYYLLLNSDVEIRDKGWTEPLLHYMDLHKDCAACAPKLHSLLQPDMFEYAGAAGGYVDVLGFPYCRGRVMNHVEKDMGQYDSIVPLLWASGAALMVRAEDYWFAGGLDDRFFAHMEEIDLCWRLRTLGKQIVCIPESTVYHLGGATLSQGNPRKTFLNFRNNMLMLYKNLPRGWKMPVVVGVRVVLNTVAGLAYYIKGDKGNGNAVFKAQREFFRLVPDFKKDRAQNLDRRVVRRVPEVKGLTIVAAFR